ncbi:MAG: DUF1684 domain-containing protein [Candidatus Geothermarchaeales archaeon]
MEYTHDVEYASMLEQYRREKDKYFAEAPDSPIPPDQRHRFTGLRYFPVDPKCRFFARLIEHDEPQKVSMVTSRGTVDEYLKQGYLKFELEGQTHRLQGYRSLRHHHEESLFVPFRDATSGEETYSSSRYVDVHMSEEGVYELDFNTAYNPYCAYSDDYTCPLAPQENWLRIPIRAGEKNYKKSQQ